MDAEHKARINNVTRMIEKNMEKAVSAMGNNASFDGPEFSKLLATITSAVSVQARLIREVLNDGRDVS